MNTATLTLSAPALTADVSVVLSATPVKGRTLITLDLTGFDESLYVYNNLRIEWGDTNAAFAYKREPALDYTVDSIFDEVLYGKLNGSIMTTYTHEYNSVSAADIVIYLLEIFAWSEQGYRYDASVYVPVYPESYYDTLDELEVASTQMTPLSTSYTVANLESKSSGQVLVCVLSS
jgi:hypothetical protein